MKNILSLFIIMIIIQNNFGAYTHIQSSENEIEKRAIDDYLIEACPQKYDYLIITSKDLVDSIYSS